MPFRTFEIGESVLNLRPKDGKYGTVDLHVEGEIQDRNLEDQIYQVLFEGQSEPSVRSIEEMKLAPEKRPSPFNIGDKVTEKVASGVVDEGTVGVITTISKILDPGEEYTYDVHFGGDYWLLRDESELKLVEASGSPAPKKAAKDEKKEKHGLVVGKPVRVGKYLDDLDEPLWSYDGFVTSVDAKGFTMGTLSFKFSEQGLKIQDAEEAAKADAEADVKAAKNRVPVRGEIWEDTNGGHFLIVDEDQIVQLNGDDPYVIISCHVPARAQGWKFIRMTATV